MSNWFPPPARPRPVEGGLKARSKRGAIGQTWWSGRFLEVLESMGMGSRLSRGRTYARKGQVIDMTLDSGSVTAAVQGSRARPYRVRIGVSSFGKAEWSRVCQALVDDAWYAAALLSGEMPPDIEDLFAAVGLSLFPASAAELTMDCTCPDWGVPCKHLAAAFYLLAESFDDDPFAILALRGRDRETLLDTLSALRTGTVAADQVESADDATPLGDCLDTFYEPAGELPVTTVDRTPADSVLDQLPDVDVSVRGVPLIEVLRPVYVAGSAQLPSGQAVRAGGVQDGHSGSPTRRPHS